MGLPDGYKIVPHVDFEFIGEKNGFSFVAIVCRRNGKLIAPVEYKPLC